MHYTWNAFERQAIYTCLYGFLDGMDGVLHFRSMAIARDIVKKSRGKCRPKAFKFMICKNGSNLETTSSVRSKNSGSENSQCKLPLWPGNNYQQEWCEGKLRSQEIA